MIELLYPRVDHGREVWPAMFLPMADCVKHPHPMRWDRRVSNVAQLPCPYCDPRASIYCLVVGANGAPERLYFAKVVVRHEEPGTQGLAPIWIDGAKCHKDDAHDPDEHRPQGWGGGCR